MKTLLAIILTLILNSTAYAALTVDNIPRTKTGGSAPSLQDSAISQSGSNIGIGSTVPGAKLDVNGAIRASGTITGLNLSGTNTGDQTSVSGNSGTVTFADAGGDTTTFLALGTAATGSLSPATDAELTYNATTDTLTTTTFIGALTGNSSTATALAANPTNCSAGNYPLGIDASGNAENCTAAGGGSSQWLTTSVGIGTYDRVGIGTITPNASLVVASGNVGIGSVNPVSALCVGSTCQGRISSAGAVTSVGISNTGSAITNNNSYTQSGTSVNTFTGNVGIGASPSYPLDVTGQGKISTQMGIGANPSSTNELYIVSGGETTISIEKSGVRAMTMGIDNSSGNFTIAQSGSLTVSPFFTQTGAGLTGINESTPDALLEINPGGLTLSGAPLFAVDSTTSGGAGDGDAFIITSTASNNNVGINSTAPGTRLDVQGVIRASSDIQVGAQSVCQEDGTNCPASSGTNYWSLTAGAGNVGISTTHTVGIGTTRGSAALAIMPAQNGNANVGIGTWNPIALLEVKGTVNATALVGPLTGNVTGNVSGTAATVTTAAQPAITSVGTLTALDVDNLNLNGNTISSTAGTDLNITPLAGQQLVLDGTIEVDAGVVTGATSVTSTAFVGALTGNASTATALQNARTIGGTSFDGTSNIVPATITVADTTDSTSSIALFESATGDLAPKTDGGITYNASTGALSATSFTGAGTGLTGTASSLTAGTVTTNANLTGPITSTGNATAVASQTGTGTTFVMQATPTLTTPVIGAATGTSLALSGNIGVGGAGVATNPLQVTGRAGVTQNIGIGTTFGQHALSVMSGNVGIGTWNPQGALQIANAGNVGIGTVNAPTALYVVGTGFFTTGLNIGIGTASATRLCIANNAVTVCP